MPDCLWSQGETFQLLKRTKTFFAKFYENFSLKYPKNPYFARLHSQLIEQYQLDQRQIWHKDALYGDATGGFNAFKLFSGVNQGVPNFKKSQKCPLLVLF